MDPISGLPLGGERDAYRQRTATSRLKSTARRLVKRRVGGHDNAQALRASRRDTALLSPRTLSTPAE
jgi:hypothetical protein